MNPADIATRELSPLSLSASNLWFCGSTFSFFPEFDWPNLEVGDNFTFSSNHGSNLLQKANDTYLNNLSACIMCIITDFSETSSCLNKTGFYVTNTVNNLVDLSARLISISDPFDNLVDPSTCLISSGNMANISFTKIINISEYSSLS